MPEAREIDTFCFIKIVLERQIYKWTCVCEFTSLWQCDASGVMETHSALCFQFGIFGGSSSLKRMGNLLLSLYEWDAGVYISEWVCVIIRECSRAQRVCVRKLERGAIGRKIEFNRKTSTLVLITSTLRSMVFRAAQPEPINFLSGERANRRIDAKKYVQRAAVSYILADNKVWWDAAPSAFYPLLHLLTQQNWFLVRTFCQRKFQDTPRACWRLF